MHSHFSVNKEWHQYFLEFNTRLSFSCIIEKNIKFHVQIIYSELI